MPLVDSQLCIIARTWVANDGDRAAGRIGPRILQDQRATVASAQNRRQRATQARQFLESHPDRARLESDLFAQRDECCGAGLARLEREPPAQLRHGYFEPEAASHPGECMQRRGCEGVAVARLWSAIRG